MDRRNFVTGLGVAGAAVLATRSALAEDHAAHAAAKRPPAAPMSKPMQTLIDTTSRCRTAGELCLAHCTDNLAAGDASMAACQRAVMNMLAVVEAMHRVAAYRSAADPQLKALAKVCADFCAACETACAPHAAHHAECKRCKEACAACVKACNAVSA